MKDLRAVFRSHEETLGRSGELGLRAALLDSHGNQRAEVSFNSDKWFPMASVVKVPIGMALASKVATGSISLDDCVTVRSSTATPGPLTNPLDRLDRLYFCPFEVDRSESIGRLLSFMLRYSDNTAADTVLHHLGGISAVKDFLARSGIEGISVTRTVHELLVDYYDLPDVPSEDDRLGILKRTRNILQTIRRIQPAYSCRMDKEKRLAESREESCTPGAMTRLLTSLWKEPQYESILAEMHGCATGKRRIAAGLEQCATLVKGFAHKTGSLGAITNDAGVIEFHSGDVAVMVVMISNSSAPLSVREQTIASVATAVIAHWRAAGELRTETI